MVCLVVSLQGRVNIILYRDEFVAGMEAVWQYNIIDTEAIGVIKKTF